MADKIPERSLQVSTPRQAAAEALVTDDVVEAAMQALFEVGGRLVGATSGDWPPMEDYQSRKAIRSWLVLYALYNVPSLEELPDEVPYIFAPYDILQVHFALDTWLDYATLRTEEDGRQALNRVETDPRLFRIVDICHRPKFSLAKE